MQRLTTKTFDKVVEGMLEQLADEAIKHQEKLLFSRNDREGEQ